MGKPARLEATATEYVAGNATTRPCDENEYRRYGWNLP